MVDIGGDDRASAGDFIPHKFGRDMFRNFCPQRLAGVLLVEDIPRAVFVFHELHGGLAPHVFADGDVFHLWGDDALFRIPKLGDGVTGGGAQGLARRNG